MILITGGARSGKSKLAMQLAKRAGKKIAYIATAPVCDEEMRARVNLHKKARPAAWVTIESQKDLASSLKKVPAGCSGVIIECIGTYVSNLMMDRLTDRGIILDIKAALKSIKRIDRLVFIVSNEVGSGIVPDTESGRRFRDIVGNINQVIARQAEEVYLTVAGLPIKLK